MRRITSKEILLVSTVLTAALGATAFKEASIDIDANGCLTFVTMAGVRGGIAAIDALTDAGFNTKSDGDLATNENGVRGADGAIMQSCWIKIHDIDAPLFSDEDKAKADAEAVIEAKEKEAKAQADAAAKAQADADAEAEAEAETVKAKEAADKKNAATDAKATKAANAAMEKSTTKA